MGDGIKRNVIHEGDCIEVMKTFPDASVDAVITDPPYGLGDKPPDMQKVLSAWMNGEDATVNNSDFMGKNWRLPGPRVWEEAFRVLKPGGHVFSFSATRNFDLMMTAMRIASFEVRDKIDYYFENDGYKAWVYGCLSEDAEILTENGWKRGVDVEEGETVLTWDSETEELFLDDVEQKFIAPYEGEMVSFVNDNTDQLLTPNHRVYNKSRIRRMQNGKRRSWFENKWGVKKAGQISRWNPIFLPLSGWHDGAYNGDGIGGEKYARLLAWVWTEGGFDFEPSTAVRIYQSSVNQNHVNEIDELVHDMVPDCKHYPRDRTYKQRHYTEHSWFFTGEMAQCIRNDLPDKHPTWELMWKMTEQEKIAFIDAAVKGDGSSNKKGARSFYQNDLGDLEWFQTLLHTIGMQGRINEDKMCVEIHDNPVTQFQNRHLKRNDRVNYNGYVWCVKVPTGAFVARRNGRIFITGNSGFPKSHNISKDLAKKYGEDSELAQKWDGYGTALKPANEALTSGTKSLTTIPFENVVTEVKRVLEVVLCLSSTTNSVNEFSTSSHQGQNADMSDFVQRNVAESFRILKEEVSETTDIFKSQEVEETSLSIVSSWSAILEDLSETTSKSTTETMTNRIIALRTLKSSLLEAIYQNITHLPEMKANGLMSLVENVAGLSKNDSMKLTTIQNVSVPEDVTLQIVKDVLKKLVDFVEQNSIMETTKENSAEKSVPMPGCVADRLVNVLCRSGMSNSTAENVVACDIYPFSSGVGIYPPFKYQAKAGKKERNAGCNWMYWVERDGQDYLISEEEFNELKQENEDRKEEEGFKQHKLKVGNPHATVKPISLCRYLCRMLKMPDDTLILDPFAGSGSILCGAILEGCDYIGIDNDPMSVELSKARTHYFKCLGEDGLK